MKLIGHYFAFQVSLLASVLVVQLVSTFSEFILMLLIVPGKFVLLHMF